MIWRNPYKKRLTFINSVRFRVLGKFQVPGAALILILLTPFLDSGYNHLISRLHILPLLP